MKSYPECTELIQSLEEESRTKSSELSLLIVGIKLESQFRSIDHSCKCTA